MPPLTFLKKPLEFTITEIYDVDRLSQIAKLKDFKFLKHDPDQETKYPIGPTIKSILKNVKNGELTKTYIQKEGRVGRYYYKNGAYGLLGLPSSLRAYLVGPEVLDLDISNCHPTILLHLMGLYKIKCPELQQYVDDRETTLEKYKLDKEKFLIMLNNVNFKTNENFLVSIHNSIFKDLFPKLRDDFPNIHKIAEDTGKANNISGAFMSRIYQEFEQDIMYHVMEFFQEKEIKYGCLMFDGIHVYDTVTQSLLDSLSEYIFKELNIRVVLKIKEHDISIIEDKLEECNEEKEDIVFMEGSEFAQEFVKRYSHRIIVDQNEDIWLKWGNFWKKNCDEEINNFFSEINDIACGERKTAFSVASSASKWGTYWKLIKAQIKTTVPKNERFLHDIDFNLGFLPFNNGVYDFCKRVLHKYDSDPVKNMYFSKCVSSDLILERSPKYSTIVKIINQIFDEDEAIIEENFTFFCRSLAGVGVTDKHFLTITSPRNSGKSTLIDFFTQCFDNFVGILDARDLMSTKSLESTERKLGWVDTMIKNKLIFASEAEAAGGLLSSTVIKRITSGGDFIPAYREAFGKTKSGYIRGCLTFMAQSIPNFDTVDANNYRLSHELNVTFVSQEEIDNSKNSKTKKLLMNPEIRDLMKDPEMVNAFRQFVFSFYKPKKPEYRLLLQATKDDLESYDILVNSDRQFEKVLFERYQITSDNKDMIKSSEVNNYIKSKINTMTAPRVKKQLEGLGSTWYRTKKGVFFTNIKLNEATINDEDTSDF